MMWPNKVVEIGDFTVRGTFAIPFGADDLTHMGYLIIVKNGPTVYFTGDTRYHENLADYGGTAAIARPGRSGPPRRVPAGCPACRRAR